MRGFGDVIYGMCLDDASSWCPQSTPNRSDTALMSHLNIKVIYGYTNIFAIKKIALRS